MGISSLTTQTNSFPDILNKELKIYCLKENEYIAVSSSQLLPELNIDLLIGYLSQSNLRLAIKEFRQELQAIQKAKNEP